MSTKTIKSYENLLREMRGAGVSLSDLGAAVGWSYAETCDFFRFDRDMSTAQAFKVQALFEKRPPIAYLFRVAEREVKDPRTKKKQIRINGRECDRCLLFRDPEIKNPTKDRNTGELHNVRRVRRPADLRKLAERQPEGLLLEGVWLTYFSEPVRIPPSALSFDDQGSAELWIDEAGELWQALDEYERLNAETKAFAKAYLRPLCSEPTEKGLGYENLRRAIAASGYGRQELFELIGLTWQQTKAFFNHERDLTPEQKLRLRNLIAPTKPIGWLFETEASRQQAAGQIIRVDFQNGHLARVK